MLFFSLKTAELPDGSSEQNPDGSVDLALGIYNFLTSRSKREYVLYALTEGRDLKNKKKLKC